MARWDETDRKHLDSSVVDVDVDVGGVATMGDMKRTTFCLVQVCRYHVTFVVV